SREAVLHVPEPRLPVHAAGQASPMAPRLPDVRLVLPGDTPRSSGFPRVAASRAHGASGTALAPAGPVATRPVVAPADIRPRSRSAGSRSSREPFRMTSAETLTMLSTGTPSEGSHLSRARGRAHRRPC